LRTGIAAACLALATTSMIHADPPAVPANVTASIVSTTSVLVTWDSVAGADSYDIRRNGTTIGTSTTNSYSDPGATAGAAHIYAVRAIGPGGTSSWSSSAIAVTSTFTDTTLIPRLTPVRASHVLELRDAINTLRTAASLPPTSFTDASLTSLPVKALHVDELRSSLDGARGTLGLPAIGYTHTLTSGVTPVRAIDLTELRNGAIGRAADALFWNRVVTPAAVQSLACNAGYVFAGGEGMVRRSSDGGATWNDSTGLPAGQNVTAIVNGGDGVLFAQTANDKVHRSTNHGVAFTELASTPASFTAVVGARNGVFAIGGACASVWFSADGTSWTPRNSGISGCVTSLARARHGRLYAGTAANGVFTSTNDGTSWGAVGAGIPTNSIPAIATNRDEDVFVSADGQGVYRSTDEGGAWSSVTTGDFRSLLADSNDALVAGTESGARIHTSSDGGDSWLVASNGLPSSGEVDALCSTHRHRFALIDEQLFRAPVEFRLDGLNFGSTVDVAQSLQRLSILRPYVKTIRTFRVSNGLQHIARIARTLGIKTAIGAAITSNLSQNATEIAALKEIGLSGDADVLVVGNEVLLTNQVSASQLVAYIEEVQEAVPGVPVTTADTFDELLANPSVLAAVDVVYAAIRSGASFAPGGPIAMTCETTQSILSTG